MENVPFSARDGKEIHCLRWMDCATPRAVVQLAHGMGEHIARYDATAQALNAAGYLVYGNDHRGHGLTDPNQLGDMGEDGWNHVLDDMRVLNERIASAHAGLPRILLGHSMGSMAAMQYLYRYGHTLRAAVLSGTPGINAALQSWIEDALVELARLTWILALAECCRSDVVFVFAVLAVHQLR